MCAKFNRGGDIGRVGCGGAHVDLDELVDAAGRENTGAGAGIDHGQLAQTGLENLVAGLERVWVDLDDLDAGHCREEERPQRSQGHHGHGRRVQRQRCQRLQSAGQTAPQVCCPVC